jgi:hypothetical protein
MPCVVNVARHVVIDGEQRTTPKALLEALEVVRA